MGDDFELSLELSIGGGRYGKEIPKKGGGGGGGGDCSSDGDCNNNSVSGISRSDNEGGLGRKEIQALRRQEAKKKREERMRKWLCSGGVVEDKFGLFEAQKFQIRVRDREIRERDNGIEGLYHKVLPPAAHSSDYPTTSHKGGSSNVTGSQSSLQPRTKSPLDHPQVNESSSYDESDCHPLQARFEPIAKTITTPIAQPTHQSSILSEKSIVSPTNNRHSTLPQPTPSPKEVTGSHIPKPPPPGHTHNTTMSQHMPCVSTTGNGPNGKTITGFLYKYTNNEVSIVCVCHGTSFSPAEFVEHAGGINISNPLRHITVVPSSLGCS